MKKAALIFMAGALVLTGLVIGAFGAPLDWSGTRIVMAGIALVLIGLAVYL